MSMISQQPSLRKIREKLKIRTAAFRVEAIVSTQYVVLGKSPLLQCSILVIRFKMSRKQPGIRNKNETLYRLCKDYRFGAILTA